MRLFLLVLSIFCFIGLLAYNIYQYQHIPVIHSEGAVQVDVFGETQYVTKSMERFDTDFIRMKMIIPSLIWISVFMLVFLGLYRTKPSVKKDS